MPLSQSTDADAALSPDNTTTPSEVQTHNFNYNSLIPDEFGVFRDPEGHKRLMRRRIIHQRQQQTVQDTSEAGTKKDHLNSTDPDFNRSSIDTWRATSTDIRQEFGKRAFHLGIRRFFWEKKDEYGVYRDECGFARGVNGDIINISREDMGKLLERASMFGRSCFCLPQHAEQFAKGDPVCKLYTQAEVQYMLDERTSHQIWETNFMDLEHEKAISSLQSELRWLSIGEESRRKERDALKEEVKTLRAQLNSQKRPSTDTVHSASIDKNFNNPIENHLKKLSIDNHSRASIDKEEPEFCTREEMENQVENIYRAIEDCGDEAYRVLDKHWFPVQSDVQRLELSTASIEKEVEDIRSQLANLPVPSTSIDNTLPPSIDIDAPKSTDTTRNLEIMQLSKDMERTFNMLGTQEYSIASLEEWLERIQTEVYRLKTSMTRNEKATRSFLTSWFEESQDEEDACFPTSTCNPPH